MENISQMSLVEVALEIMKKKTGPQNIHTLIREVLELKGIDSASIDAITQLYIDITTSSKFVYMGNDEWDLKIRQSLDQFDKDGSAFNSKNDLDDEELDSVDDIIDLDEDLDEDEEDEDLDEDDEDDEDEDDLDSEDEEDLDEDDLVDDETELDDEGNPVERYSEDDDDDFDEDEYNDIMDDYEDMY